MGRQVDEQVDKCAGLTSAPQGGSSARIARVLNTVVLTVYKIVHGAVDEKPEMLFYVLEKIGRGREDLNLRPLVPNHIPRPHQNLLDSVVSN